MTRTTEEQRLAELAKRKDRDAWIKHSASCEECRRPAGICEAGTPLLKLAIQEMGDGRK